MWYNIFTMTERKVSEEARQKNRERSRQHRLANPEYYKEYNKKYREANREKNNAYRKAWRLAHPGWHARWHRENPEKAKNNYLRMKYGITLEQYNQILTQQNNGCAICSSNKPGGRSKDYFHVDHDHETR